MIAIRALFVAVAVLGAFCVVVSPFLAIGISADAISCWRTAKALQLPHRYGPIAGCIVQVRDGWVPLDSIRASR